MKILIAGGGTGGHVFPGIAIAQALQTIEPGISIVFAGTENGPEFRLVPQYGFKIFPVRVAGFNRSNWSKNLVFPVKLLTGFLDSYQILQQEKPDAVIATGGYVCGPITRLAQWQKKRTFVQEQNASAGVTSRMLGKAASRIFITYEVSRRQFPSAVQDRISCMGNPVRLSLGKTTREEALKKFGLDPKRRTILIIGGSLGAKSINMAVQSCYQEWISKGFQLIWQTGKTGADLEEISMNHMLSVYRAPFIDQMGDAYRAADLVVSRAGATSLAEITVVGLPSVLVPYPFAADDHQTANARELAAAGAAMVIPDSKVREQLNAAVMALMEAPDRLKTMAEASVRQGKPNSAISIATEILSVLKGALR